MPVQSIRIRPGDSFEEMVFSHVGRALNIHEGSFTVASPFKLKGHREYDGLIISPHAVFTLEMKNIRGTIQKGPNTPLTIFDERGQEIDLSNRFEDPVFQADMQWRELSDYFNETFATESIFVKAVLLFPNGSRFNVPPENRDFTNHRVNVLFATVSELADLVQQFRPPYPVTLSAQVQAIIAKAIRDGAHALTQVEKQQVAKISAITRPSDTASKQKAKTGTPLRSSYEVASARTSRQAVDEVSPIHVIEAEPSPSARNQPKARRKRPSWLSLLIGGGALYWLIWQLSDATAAAVWSGLFVALLWINWRKTAIYVALGGLLYGVLIWLSLPRLVAAGIALTWPLGVIVAIVGLLFGNGFESISSQTESRSPLFSEVQEAEDTLEQPDEVDSDGGDSFTEPAVPDDAQRLRVVGNSNVRAEPDIESPAIGLAEENAIFSVIDTTVDRSWYKIRLPNGAEGWIGSTRIELLDP